MRIKYFLIIFLGTLACMLLLNELVPQPLVSHDSNLVYALGRHPGDHGRHRGNQGDQRHFDSSPPISVPEPSTLLLLGAYLLGLGAYAAYAREKFSKK